MGKGRVHPQATTIASLSALLQTLERHPDKTVFLSAFLPKTVAFALGSLLGNPGEGIPQDLLRSFSSDALARIVPLHHDNVRDKLIPVRIFSWQPPIDELVEQWERIQTEPSMGETDLPEEGSSGSGRLINLTSHALQLWRDDAIVQEWDRPSAGEMPRVAEPDCGSESLRAHGLEIPVTLIGRSISVAPMPPRTPGVGYVVSRLTAAMATDRDDFYFPIEHRDAAGRVIGCTGFGRFVLPTSPEAE
ncbi:hypothetical protein [Aeromicrobium duanguangcaii]|uniref:hypothetical protein n=1 Tax=Aeromicrobium duanguangcaii TaxID=2968086 RepID=UPI00201707B3|nr:hypothetical protein [Aeromicrobium duanguangcaii]MCL3836872.1 hypothetical protein [Aeromicrobium duanguangcaii]